MRRRPQGRKEINEMKRNKKYRHALKYQILFPLGVSARYSMELCTYTCTYTDTSTYTHTIVLRDMRIEVSNVSMSKLIETPGRNFM